MPQDRPPRRKRSRSFSPVASKHKRSWQNDEPDRPARGSQRSPSPRGGGKIKQSSYKSPPSYGGRRDRPESPLGGRGLRRSPSPPRKRHLSRSPDTGRRGPSPSSRPLRDPPPSRQDSRSNNRAGRPGSTGQRQRSLSPRPVKKAGNDRGKEGYYSKRTPSPESRFQGKKKPRLSSSSPPPPPASSHHHQHHSSSSKSGGPVGGKHRAGSGGGSGRRSLSPLAPSSASRSAGGGGVGAKVGSGGQFRGNDLPQRRVSSGGKKKWSRLTLHKRFTPEDQDPFRLEENVTIAILRNPNAEPSEEVTVKRVFDSSLFKMIHKKNAGRKPIFDREEIKAWRHDENLADDPDFERRLVRVKSSSQMSGKPSSDSLSRMSPDVIRKAFGLQVGARSKSRSPNREPQIRLDPRPDPRYESKYRQQLERDERKRGGGPDGGDRRAMGRAGSMERMDKDRRRVDDGRRGPAETYDLRQALERRRSDREDGAGFRIEVRRDEGRSSDPYYRTESRGRPLSPEFGRRQVMDGGGDVGGRSVVFGGERYESLSPDRDGMRSWEFDRGGRGFRGRTRGRGRGRGMRGRRPDWSPDFRGGDDIRARSLERRPRYSNSPPNTRGWRGNRGGRGRGRGRDFNSPYRAEIVSPTEIDDSFKYTQHDDRDISPKPYRGRGGRGRFPARSFGSNNFRGARGARGGYRGRGFRGKSFGSLRDHDARSTDRIRDRSADREWKHDMYDSLQTEEEQPHSTTMST